MGQPRDKTGQRPGVVAQRGAVGPDWRAKFFVSGQVSVGVEHDSANLGRKPRQRMQRQRHAVKMLQPLVHAAHARAPATGQDYAGDLRVVNHVCFNPRPSTA